MQLVSQTYRDDLPVIRWKRFDVILHVILAKFLEIGQNIYNFGFGDYDPATNDISDTNVSNNQDTDLIMGTLGSIIYDFTNIFMEAAIFIRGPNRARTRLYQMNIK